MSFQDALKVALETQQIDEAEANMVEEAKAEDALTPPAVKLVDPLTEDDRWNGVADSMDEVANAIETALNEGNYNSSTAKMVELSVESLFIDFGVSKPMPTMESYTDVESYHRATMEGLRETAAKLREQVSQNLKSKLSAVAYVLKSDEKKLISAETRLKEVLDAFNKKKDSIPEEQKFEYGSLSTFMKTDKGIVGDIAGAVNHDFSVLQYLMKDYVHLCASTLDKIVSTVKGVQLNSNMEADKLLAKLNAIANPAIVLRNKVGSGHPLLGSNGITVTEKRGSKADHALGGLGMLYKTSIEVERKQQINTAAQLWLAGNGMIMYSLASVTGKKLDLEKAIHTTMSAVAALKSNEKPTEMLGEHAKAAIEAIASIQAGADVSTDRREALAHLGRSVESIWDNGVATYNVANKHALYIAGALTYLMESLVRRAK